MPTAITHDPTFTTPVSSTNTAVVRWSGTAGSVLQNSGVLIDGSNNITGIGTIASGAITSSGAIIGTQVDILAAGDLRLQDTTGGQYVALEANGTTTTHTLTLPAAQGAADTFLKNNGSGALSWAAAGGAFTREGGTTTEVTHNATSSTQILASGTVSIPATTPMFLTVNSRKTGGAASQCRLQWQLNTTVDHERGIHSASNQVESFIARAFVGPRATNYQTIFMTSENSSAPNNTVAWNSGSIAMPIATLTAVDLFANALNSSQTQGCNYLHVYTHAVS